MCVPGLISTEGNVVKTAIENYQISWLHKIAQPKMALFFSKKQVRNMYYGLLINHMKPSNSGKTAKRKTQGNKALGETVAKYF